MLFLTLTVLIVIEIKGAELELKTYQDINIVNLSND